MPHAQRKLSPKHARKSLPKHPPLRLIYSGRNKKPPRTESQRAATQLNWMLYWTEGYLTNLERAMERHSGVWELRVMKTAQRAHAHAVFAVGQIRKEIAWHKRSR